MIQVTKKDYEELRARFFSDHELDIRSSDVYPISEHCYRKLIVLNDGSSWNEIRSIATKNIDFCLCGQKVNITIDVLKVEFYSTDDTISRFCYLAFCDSYTNEL